MDKEFMEDRRKALEESFFAREDRKRVEELKAKMQAKEQRATLAAASGLRDGEALDHLAKVGISAETLVAFSLVPLVVVAWADGSLDGREAEAVLRAAADSGVAEGTPAWEMLRGWLVNMPDPGLMAAWKEYVFSLKAELKEVAVMELKNQVLTRARTVAESAGGFLGLGKKISAAEQTALEELEAAFS
jgi:hypothetical protein